MERMNNYINQIVNQAMNNSAMMQNPMFSNAVGLYRSHDSNGLRNLAENICRENGTSFEEMKRKLISG